MLVKAIKNNGQSFNGCKKKKIINEKEKKRMGILRDRFTLENHPFGMLPDQIGFHYKSALTRWGIYSRIPCKT